MFRIGFLTKIIETWQSRKSNNQTPRSWSNTVFSLQLPRSVPREGQELVISLNTIFLTFKLDIRIFLVRIMLRIRNNMQKAPNPVPEI